MTFFGACRPPFTAYGRQGGEGRFREVTDEISNSLLATEFESDGFGDLGPCS